MADDDIYVNNGDTYVSTDYQPEPFQTVQQKEQLSHDQAIKAASYPIMADVADWFDTQIDGCDSRRTINAYAAAKGYQPNQLEDVARAFDIVRELLEAKSLEFTEFRREDA